MFYYYNPKGPRQEQQNPEGYERLKKKKVESFPLESFPRLSGDPERLQSRGVVYSALRMECLGRILMALLDRH